MTDAEAIRAYLAAARYRKSILKSRIPRFIERDPVALEKVTERWRVDIKTAELVMQQAERAVEKLPRQTWREAVRLRFLEGMDVFSAGEAMFYSEKSIRRFEWAAFAFLETGKEPDPDVEPPEGP